MTSKLTTQKTSSKRVKELHKVMEGRTRRVTRARQAKGEKRSREMMESEVVEEGLGMVGVVNEGKTTQSRKRAKVAVQIGEEGSGGGGGGGGSVMTGAKGKNLNGYGDQEKTDSEECSSTLGLGGSDSKSQSTDEVRIDYALSGMCFTLIHYLTQDSESDLINL